MVQPVDHQVLGPGQVQLKKRPQVVVYPQSDDCFVLEDPVRGKFFRLGAVEYQFFARLDGQRTVREILAELASNHGTTALNEQEALGMAEWFVEQELADTHASRSAGQQAQQSRRAQRGRRFAWNPLFIKTRMGNPDRMLDRLLPMCRLAFSWPAIMVWFLVVSSACLQVVTRTDRLAQESVGILAPQNWIQLLLVWVMLKGIHECAHGVACKAWGVPVREWGVMWVLASPMAYVDATAAWRLPEKWCRIAISMAGMYAELFLAAVAAWVWICLDRGLMSHLCYQVMITAGVSTLVFNANPLMRFDGYFVLSDLWEVPNLSVLAQRNISYFLRKFVWGLPASKPSVARAKRWGILVYSVLAWIWRITMMLGLIVAAQRMFWGAGTILAILTTVMWLGVPVLRGAIRIWQGKEQACSWIRLATVASTLSLVASAAFFWIPWPVGISAPAIVEGQNDAVLRARSPGFIRRILVTNDQEVQAGQVVMVLENDALDQELQDLQLQIAQIVSRRDELLDQGDLAAEQSQHRFQEALEKRFHERTRDCQQLAVKAPRAGRVWGPSLNDRLGTFVEAGTELMRVLDHEKQVRISVHQDDGEYFRAILGRDTWVSPRSGVAFPARLVEVQPHASVQVFDSQLTALEGGPLAVQPRPSHAPVNGQQAGPEHELLAPRLVAIAQVPAGIEAAPYGMVAQVSFYAPHDTVGRHLIRSMQEWIDGRLGR